MNELNLGVFVGVLSKHDISFKNIEITEFKIVLEVFHPLSDNFYTDFKQDLLYSGYGLGLANTDDKIMTIVKK